MAANKGAMSLGLVLLGAIGFLGFGWAASAAQEKVYPIEQVCIRKITAITFTLNTI